MNPYQDLFDAQKACFSSNVTRTYEWRIEQLDRMGRMVAENEADLQKAIARDFKTASQEYVSRRWPYRARSNFRRVSSKRGCSPSRRLFPAF
jgi:aldehyde dehydrogenase (NAD+)